jgi:hypothetical protein
MKAALPKAGIDYVHLKALGGFRKPVKGSEDQRGVAKTPGFAATRTTCKPRRSVRRLDQLEELLKEMKTVYCCTEVVFWRCHRQLVFGRARPSVDIVSGNIFGPGKVEPHKPTESLKLDEGRMTYPGDPEESRRVVKRPCEFLQLSSVSCCVLACTGGKLWQAFQNHVRASGAELAAVDRGEAISKMLSSGNEREITAFGMIQVAASGDVLVQRFRDITIQESRTGPRNWKILPVADPSGFEVSNPEAEESAALKACDVGRCDLKLSRAMIQRARRDSRVTNSSDLLKQILFDYLRSYLSTGNSALAKYEDKSTPGDLAREFQDLLNTAPYLRDYAPEFVSYLQTFPQNKPQAWRNSSTGRRKSSA